MQHTREVRDIARYKIKLKLVAGAYILRVNRACFNQNEVDSTCVLCNPGDEDLGNFCSVVLQCFGQGPMPNARNILGASIRASTGSK